MRELEAVVRTDVGLVRSLNEDAFLVLPERDLFVVADGMGGHNSGDVASQITVSSMMSFYEDDELTAELKKRHRKLRRRNPESALPKNFMEYRIGKAIESANYSIFSTAQRIPKYRDMGTTIVAMHFVGSRVYIGWVGDSRVYRIRGGKISQLSEDHSLANEYVRMNILRKEDIRTFPYKNVIVRALGLAGDVEVDTVYRNSKEGDIYLCCSDGLTDLVEDQDILDVVQQHDGDLNGAADELVTKANEAGGVDNTTVLLVRVGAKKQ